MTRPARYILRMVLFLLVAGSIGVLLLAQIERAFFANPGLNAVIFGVALIGIIFIFRQVLVLGGAVRWLESYHRGTKTTTVIVTDPPGLLAPMARMLDSRKGNAPISAQAMQSILDSISSRLDESRELARYLIGLLVFLGLLGTFWGLLETVGSVGDTIKGLSIAGASDPIQLFESLKRGLEGPLSGMGTAFSASMLGLAGSLVLGFLDLQAGAAQGRFYNELEDWLSGITRVGAGGVAEGDQSIPVYVQALLEQTAEALEKLQRTMASAEDSRSAANHGIVQLAERLAMFTDQMQAQLELLQRMADQRGGTDGFDAASRNHLRNLDVYVTRMLDEVATGRARAVEDLRSELKLLARTVAMAADERRKAGG